MQRSFPLFTGAYGERGGLLPSADPGVRSTEDRPVKAGVRLRNRVRNRLRGSMIGRALLQWAPEPPIRSIKLVCATRLSEKHFWRNAALGQSLKPWLSHPMVSAVVHPDNRLGLPKVYNPHLAESSPGEVLVFVHDDVWIDDTEWIAKLRLAFGRFDIVGVAGNRRISRDQPAWLFRSLEGDRFAWDHGFLSGAIGHGPQAKGSVSVYGPSPAACELLDGVWLAARGSVVRRSGLSFDERFDFHFYDMDLCRQARRAGLSLGTWPIELTHQSGGAFGSPGWQAGHALYRGKWKT